MKRLSVRARRRIIARPAPAQPKSAASPPDFLGRLRKIYGPNILKTSGAELLAAERSRR